VYQRFNDYFTFSASKRAVNSSKFGMLVVKSTEPVRSEGGAGKLREIAAEGFGAPPTDPAGGVRLKVNGLMD